MGRWRSLARLLPAWTRIAWWGLVTPRVSEREPLVVHQAVVCRGDDVLLAVRADLRGWELPGGAAHPGEGDAEALRREVREETGLDVEIVHRVGDYVRSGFRPHTARVFLCRPQGGALRPSAETPDVRWFARDALPATLFPWYRSPLADALSGRRDVERRETQGPGWVLEAMRIDLRMRLGEDP